MTAEAMTGAASAFAWSRHSARPIAAAADRAGRGGSAVCRRVKLSPPLGLRREMPPTAMRTRVRAPLAAAPPPSQVAIEPDAPQRPLGAGRGAIADFLLAALHL